MCVVTLSIVALTWVSAHSVRAWGYCRVQSRQSWAEPRLSLRVRGLLMSAQVKRPCLDCGVPTFGNRCSVHHAAHRAKYGPAHQAERAAWAPAVAAGGVICWRCGEPIVPGTEWDLGHRLHQRSHPEHAVCNRSADESGVQR